MKYEEIDVPATLTALSPVILAFGYIIKLLLDAAKSRREMRAEMHAMRAEVKESKVELDEIVRLSNGTHLGALKMAASLGRQLARATPTVEALNAARDAERALEEYMVAKARAAEKAEQLKPPHPAIGDGGP